MAPNIVKTLHDTFRKAMDDPGFLSSLERFTMEPFYMSSEDYGKWARKAYEYEKRQVERLGLGVAK